MGEEGVYLRRIASLKEALWRSVATDRTRVGVEINAEVGGSQDAGDFMAHQDDGGAIGLAEAENELEKDVAEKEVAEKEAEKAVAE